MAAEIRREIELEIGHVLFIDIVGYSKLLINEQSEVLHELNDLVRATERVRAADAAGKLIRLPAGDGMALVFRDRPEGPAECALEIAQALKSHPAVQVRMGIHSGPVNEIADVNERSNIAGAGINIAQRVMDCGDAGHILLSKRVADDLAQYRHWQPLLHDLGECEVKHGTVISVANLYTDELGNPAVPKKFQQANENKQTARTARSPAQGKPLLVVLTILISLMGLGIVALIFAPAAIKFFAQSRATETKSATSVSPTATWPAVPPIPEKSIAVLPFANLSADKENAFFADGVHDEILTDLAKVADLKVISRTSVMSYRGAGAQRNLPEIARALGVANILEGSVQRAAGRVRVTAQLIDARTDNHLWAEKYDRDLVDVFAIQSDIAQAIVTQLRAKLSPQEKAALKEPSTSDLGAYDLYLRAKEIQERSTSNIGSRGNSNLEAAKLLEQATARDPGFVRAWCLLARTHDNLYWFKNDPTPERRAMAGAAIEAAARLQPDSGEVHLARAWHAYWGYRDFDAARTELAIATRSLPNLAGAYELTGFIDRREGREEDSNRNLQRALELDPRNIGTILGLRNNYTRQRRYADAAKLLDGVLAWKPDDVLVQYERARLERIWRADPRPVHAVLYGLAAAAKLDDIALQRMSLAFYERDYDAAEKALAASKQTKLETNGYVWPRAWYEGEIARGRGDQEKARSGYAAARLEAAATSQPRPDDPKLLMILAEVDSALGNKAEALREAERAVDLAKGKDALDRVSLLEKLLRVYIRTGEKSRALDLLESLAKTPSGLHYGDLRLDSDFDPLRNGPRFEKIVASLAPKDAKQ